MTAFQSWGAWILNAQHGPDLTSSEYKRHHLDTHTHTLSPTRRIAPIILCKENYTCQIKYKVQVLAQQ